MTTGMHRWPDLSEASGLGGWCFSNLVGVVCNPRSIHSGQRRAEGVVREQERRSVQCSVSWPKASMHDRMYALRV
jgi:hypothetical protein